MRRHQLDLTSLLCGLVFLGVGVVYLVGEISGEDVDVTWALPVTLIALGLAVVAGGLDRARRRPDDTAPATATAPQVTTGDGAENSAPDPTDSPTEPTRDGDRDA